MIEHQSVNMWCAALSHKNIKKCLLYYYLLMLKAVYKLLHIFHRNNSKENYEEQVGSSE